MSTSRISTLGTYQSSLAQILAKQTAMAKTQQQLASGSRLTTGADDPLAAGSATTMDRSVARLAQYDKNATAVQNRLNMQESALGQVNELLSSARTLVIQANSDTMSSGDRADIAKQIQSIKDQLVSLANGTDGVGRYLFGGTDDGSLPFTTSAGSVAYNGNQTQRKVEVAGSQQVSDTIPGSQLFMQVRVGNGTATANADNANTGQAVLLGYSVDDAATWNGQTYKVVFDSASTYHVEDGNGTSLTAAGSGTYTSGSDISYGGVTLQVRGTPAAGDSMTVGAAGTRSVFDTLDELVSALTLPNADGSRSTEQSNRMQASLQDLTTAEQHFIDARASGGAQLNAIDQANQVNEAYSATMKASLSDLRDLDYAEAASRYSMDSTALQAAQTVFMQMQQSSLFKLIG
mgnify:CR=1 FL=1